MLEAKLANRHTGLTPVIRNRYSPRVFSARAVTAAELERMFEAARWTASCFNDQPWHFVYGTKEDATAFAAILSALVPFNQGWAQHAAVVGFSVARSTFEKNGKPNGWAMYDTGAAMAQLTAQATSEGLVVHQMGGFDPAKAREVLGLPEGFEPAAAFAVGEAGALAGDDAAPGVRRAASEFAFRGRWGQV